MPRGDPEKLRRAGYTYGDETSQEELRARQREERPKERTWSGTGERGEPRGGRRRSEEALDPEINERMRRATELSRGLRERPLVSGMAARNILEDQLKQQSAAMGGVSPAASRAALNQGVGLGRKVLDHTGKTMAQEAVGRFSEGTKQALAWKALQEGNITEVLKARLLSWAQARQLDERETAALMNAVSTGLGTAADLGAFDDLGKSFQGWSVGAAGKTGPGYASSSMGGMIK